MTRGTFRSAALITLVLLNPIFAPAGENKNDHLSACATTECVRAEIPRDSRTKLSDEACKALEGKSAANSGTETGADLSFVCRLALARNRANFRKDAPCSGATDIDTSLGQSFLRTFYNQSTWTTVDGRPIEKLPDSYGTGSSEAYGSTVFEREFRYKDNEGEAREASYMTFFCISENPKRYVPYFHALKVDGQTRASAAVGRLPHSGEQVMRQLGRFEPEYVKSTEFVDLNRDGVKDLLVLSDHVTRGYSITACLYQKDASTCQVVGPSRPQVPPTGVVSAKISRDKIGLSLTMSDERDQAVAQIVYRINGSSLELGDGQIKSPALAKDSAADSATESATNIAPARRPASESAD